MVKGATDIVVKPVQVYNQRSKLKAAEMEDIERRSARSMSSLDVQTPPRSPSLAPPQSDALDRPRSAGRGCGSTTGAVFKASASGVGTFFKSYGKFYLDVPLAVTEGLREAPKLYGEKVEARAPITDWKSGALVGGKNFVTGIGGGFADLFYQPYKGGRDGGAAGAALGVGKGVMNMATKTASGMCSTMFSRACQLRMLTFGDIATLGIVTYPGQGIYQSIRTAVKSKTRQNIAAARQVEGEYLARNIQVDIHQVLQRFDELCRASEKEKKGKEREGGNFFDFGRKGKDKDTHATF